MAKHKIYVASSWRNEFYHKVVETLRNAGHDVYDFRNPPSGGNGFRWSDISPYYDKWTPNEYRDHMNHPLAVAQLKNDIDALKSCDCCVLVLPCGRSAHTEAGWMAGAGKKVLVYIPTRQEPELMYGLFNNICTDINELIASL